MDKALNKILEISSPEALQAFYSWLTFKYVTFTIGIAVIIGCLVLCVWMVKAIAKSME